MDQLTDSNVNFWRSDDVTRLRFKPKRSNLDSAGAILLGSPIDTPQLNWLYLLYGHVDVTRPSLSGAEAEISKFANHIRVLQEPSPLSPRNPHKAKWSKQFYDFQFAVKPLAKRDRSYSGKVETELALALGDDRAFYVLAHLFANSSLSREEVFDLYPLTNDYMEIISRLFLLRAIEIDENGEFQITRRGKKILVEFNLIEEDDVLPIPV